MNITNRQKHKGAIKEENPEPEKPKKEKPKKKKNLPAVKADSTEEALLRVTNVFLTCNTCYLKDACPKFNEGERCSYELPVELNDGKDILEMVKSVVKIQYGRIVRGKLIEESDGGVPDKVLTEEIKTLMSILKDMKELSDSSDSLTIKAKGKASSGIIQKLFGGDMDKQ